MKTVGSGRKIKYQEQESFIIREVTSAWEQGNPLSKGRCYDILISNFGNDDCEWVKKMDLMSGFITPALSQWLSRTLQRHGYTIRKESISQTVPINWLQIAVDACEVIRQTMKKAKVTRLLNMDEVFLNFHPKDTHLVAPINSKRIGSNRAEDAKKGCTIAVSCELMQSQLLAPFVIMDGKSDGYLARRYENWDGPAAIKFQSKHWMDTPTAIQYLDWLLMCYPGERIGLIWDFAAAHKAVDVIDHAAMLGITLAYIPGGLTSILQICDLYVNKPLKQSFKRMYCSWKMQNDPGPGGKYKVPRDNVIQWIEDSVRSFNQNQEDNKGIAHAFKKYGQDFRCEESLDFVQHLSTFSENCIYSSLLENQTAVDFD